MNADLPATAKIILYVFCGFIIAINLSLVFALRGRARDEAALREQRARRKSGSPPWVSKLDQPAAELNQRVRELNQQDPASTTDTHPPTGAP